MKKFSKSLLLFFVVFIIEYALFVLVFYNNYFKNKIPNIINQTGGFSLQMFRDFERTENIDILFVGSSHCYHSFDPRVFISENITTFNLATPAQRQINRYFLLQHYLKIKKVKVVALEVYWEMFNDLGLVEATMKIISNHDLNTGFIEMGLFSKSLPILNSMLTLSIHRLTHPLRKEKAIGEPYVKYIKGAFKESPFNNNPTIEIAKEKPYKVEITASEILYFQKTLELLKSNNCKVVLIMTPTAPAYKNLSLNYTSIVNTIDSSAKIHNIPFLNYNDGDKYLKNGFNIQTDFIDMDHLSKTGAAKLSRAVLKDLRKIRIL
jgi:hypothetical protein